MTNLSAPSRVGGAASDPGRATDPAACLAIYDELRHGLGSFQRQVREQYARQIRCGAGCVSCCRTRLSVSRIEATGIRRSVTEMTGAARAALRARLLDDARQANLCAFLVDGACAIYESRPMLCRIHGLPSSSTSYPEGAIDVCELNFEEFDIDHIEPEAVLDGDHVGNLLALLDFRFTSFEGRELHGRSRIPLLELAREGVELPADGPDDSAAAELTPAWTTTPEPQEAER